MRFEISPFTNEPFKSEYILQHDILTILNKLTGNFPIKPAFFGSKIVGPLGITDGVQIYFWWSVTRLFPGEDIIQLDYSVYSGPQVVSPAPTTGGGPDAK